MDFPYVVHTAELAKQWNEQYPHEICSINQLISEAALERPDDVCTGMPLYDSESMSWRLQQFTCRELHLAVITLATYYADSHLLPQRCKNDGQRNLIIGILASSSLEFLLNWLAILRLGCGALLIAPQCSAEAVTHLMKKTEAVKLLYDDKTESLAHASSAHGIDPASLVHFADRRCILQQNSDGSLKKALSYQEESNTLAIVFHTSGSTGMPKPIYQTHQVWTKALSRKPSFNAFTTTPLYHGGLSDLLRAFMSNSQIYLFTADRPITADNVVKSIEACPEIRYFLAVPYVLKMLAEHGKARQLLARMDMISVGGAPLPQELGDEMVKQFKWKLVSRMGSSECGFLMSSYRKFESDQEWSYLRNPVTDGLLHFETSQDRIAELVVSGNWPTLNATNRKDGSFATGDLYEKHSSIHNGWRYHGRADDVLVMLNGEKFSPGPLESILSAHPSIDGALVVGANRSHSAALLFLHPNAEPSLDLKSLIENANAQAPSYAHLSLENVKLLATSDHLPKTSKGTLRRAIVEQMYSETINGLYSEVQETLTSQKRIMPDELLTLIMDFVTELSPKLHSRHISEEADLFNLGFDSLMAARIRQKILVKTKLPARALPNNVVFENPSVRQLVDYILLLQDRKASSCNARISTNLKEIALNFSRFSNCTSESNSSVLQSDRKIILTGATGSLGAHTLIKLLKECSATRIICLVRAVDSKDARDRVLQNLKHRHLELPDAHQVSFVASDLTLNNLGLSSESLKDVQTASLIIHCAWSVNFSWRLSSFLESQIRGLQALIQQLLFVPVRNKHFIFCSSIASVLQSSGARIEEILSDRQEDCGSLGYSQSKWIAEQICAKAAGPTLRVSIARVGQLCGDTQHGIWNETEGWPLLIRTANVVHALPALEEDISWLPTDVAAEALVDIDLHHTHQNLDVYHIYNPQKTSWNVILEQLAHIGLKFDRAPAPQWLALLEESSQSHEDNPSIKLLTFWKQIYGEGQAHETQKSVDTSRATKVSQALRDSRAVDRELLQKMIETWQRSRFL